MIIKALCDYYDTLADLEGVKIAPLDYSSTNVYCAVNILSDKNFEIIDLRNKEKRRKKEVLIPKSVIVPERLKRSSGVFPYFLCDNAEYVFGVKFDNKGNIVNSANSTRKFEAFKKLHNDILKDCNDDGAKAILGFLNNWNPKTSSEEKLNDCDKSLFSSGSIVFFFDGKYIHDKEEIKKLWEIYRFNLKSKVLGQCLVSGKEAKIAKLHPNIKGVKAKNAPPAGAAIVSFNIDSFTSYGKEQSLNAPVSETAAFKYTTALNHILQNYNQRVQVADATTVFWAEKIDKPYCDYALELLSPGSFDSDNKEATEQDKNKEKEIKAVLTNVIAGKKIYEDAPDVNENTKFYILGLSPNIARLSIRFFHQDTFSDFAKKVAQHYEDLEIEGIPLDIYGKPENIPLWKILGETVVQNSKDKKISPLLGGAVMRAILTGAVYPFDLYAAIIRRIRCEPDKQVNYIRAALIKAYLKRKYEDKNNDKEESKKNKEIMEVLQVSLNEESTNTAYRLGRLFAFLEKAQENANPGINATIKDKYFSTASASPGAVFPLLLRLNNHHISKLEFKGKWLDIEIGKIFNGIDKFPAHLNMDEQGLFILGYYHQRQWFFRKKDENDVKDEPKLELENVANAKV